MIHFIYLTHLAPLNNLRTFIHTQKQDKKIKTGWQNEAEIKLLPKQHNHKIVHSL